MGWAREEFETIDRGDKRLVDSPSASIHKACQGWKETQAAYRLISNDVVNAEAIAESHSASHGSAACGIVYSGHQLAGLQRTGHRRSRPTAVRSSARDVSAFHLFGEICFILPACPGMKSRPVLQQLYFKRQSIPNGKEDEEKGILKVTCLVAQEINPPKGEKPVQWRLLTNRTVETLAEASELIDWYRARWEMEMFFAKLKNACKIEKLQLKSMPELEVAIALYTVVAWRINRLMRLGCECPELDPN